jgi:hypothetical protein
LQNHILLNHILLNKERMVGVIVQGTFVLSESI